MTDTPIEEKSIWSRIRDYFFETDERRSLLDYFSGPAENSIAFTIAIVALSAKMAKADGHVSVDEVRTLRQIFEINAADEKEVGKVFDLARQDVAGFDSYAQKIYRLFSNRPEMLDDIFESLFILSLSDGQFHENEDLFLEEVRKIFHVRENFYRQLKERHITEGKPNPFEVLGVERTASAEDIRKAYRDIVRNNHPDALRAKGLPAEAIALAEVRIRAANLAYQMLTL